MKYINREYGFPGRPPYFKDFYEEQQKGPQITGACYPSSPLVGAGLDPHAPNGAVLVGKHGSMWGIRLSYFRNGGWVDGLSFIHDFGKMYASSQNGNFTYFSHGDITATFVTYKESAIVISVSAIANTSVRVIFYPVAPSDGVFKANEKCIKGSAPFHATVKGKTSISEEGCVFKNRYDAYFDGDAETRECFIAHTYTEPNSITPSGDSVIYEYSFSNKDNSRLMLYAEVGTDKIFSAKAPSTEELIAGISRAEIQFTSEKTSGSGTLGANTEAAVNSVMWHRVYNPYFLSTTYFPRRETLDEFFAYSGKEFNTALLTGALLGDINSTLSSVQFGVGDRFISILTGWVAFSRTRDYDALARLYSQYKSALPPTSELVLANWKHKTMVGYKMDGSPLKEAHRKENVYSLDASCFNLLANDILERMAIIVGREKDAQSYASAKQALRDRINDVLWNADLGIYMNRYESGEFADSIGITSFYPLLAGAVTDNERLASVLAYLTHPKKFWGEYVIPTISKDHPEYGKKIKDVTGRTISPYEGFRGLVSPVMNYLVYLGLVRVGADGIAEELASRSGKIYKKHVSYSKHFIMNAYLPNGRLSEDGGLHNAEGNLLAAMGTSALIDVEYFRDDLKRAIRFGTTLKGEHTVNNLSLFGRKYSLAVRDTITYLIIDGKEVFTGEGGRFSVRQFFEKQDYCEFLVRSEANVKITVNLPTLTPSGDNTKVILAVEQGKSKVVINGAKVEVTKIQ